MSFIINPYWYAQTCSDADANAFLTATGITNPTISSAVCTLVTSLKSASLWNKFNAIYPMVGGTATTHMYNLRNPANTNAAFRLSFIGGWTHSANGALPNGTNAYADTFFTPTFNGIQNSHHLSYYSRTNSNLTEVEFGSFDSPNGSLIEIRTANVSYFRVNNGSGFISSADTNSRAFYLANRTASNLINAWRNSTKLVQSTTLISSTLGTLNYYLAAFNSSTPTFYSRKECSFASIGQGFSDSEASSVYSIIQTFQTTLGRQV